MVLPAWLTGASAGIVKEGFKAVGSGVSNLLDRFAPKKMSEAEKWSAAKDRLDYEIETGKLEISDVNKAREMYMTFLRTQKVPWIARLMNSIYRPFCGFMAILYLTDKLWSQILTQLFNGFTWTLIARDPWADGMVACIVYFFFGYRQRSKEKGVAGIQ